MRYVDVKKKYNGVWLPFTIPSFTGYTTLGTVSASTYYEYSNSYAWRALDGNYGPPGTYSPGESYGWKVHTYSTAWWKWVLPYKLRIRSLWLASSADYDNNTNFAGRFYTSDAKTTPIGDSIDVGYNKQWVIFTPANQTTVITDTIYFDMTSSTNGGIGELFLDADYLKIS